MVSSAACVWLVWYKYTIRYNMGSDSTAETVNRALWWDGPVKTRTKLHFSASKERKYAWIEVLTLTVPVCRKGSNCVGFYLVVETFTTGNKCCLINKWTIEWVKSVRLFTVICCSFGDFMTSTLWIKNTLFHCPSCASVRFCVARFLTICNTVYLL